MGIFGRGARARREKGDPLQLALWSARDASSGWNVRISRRASRMSMRVSPGGRVEVVVPPGVGIPAVERFVAKHREWAESRLRELALHAPLAADRRPSKVELALTGERWVVEYSQSARASVKDTGEGVLQVRTPQSTDPQVGGALLRWLTREAHGQLRDRLDVVATETGFDYSRLLLRRQRTRWGSCSARGAISLNLCLLFQSPAVLRYLLCHELSHTEHMNHSARFWRRVEQCEPQFRALDAELLRTGWSRVPQWVLERT